MFGPLVFQQFLVYYIVALSVASANPFDCTADNAPRAFETFLGQPTIEGVIYEYKDTDLRPSRSHCTRIVQRALRIDQHQGQCTANAAA